MLLNYLYQEYLETSEFCKLANIQPAELSSLQKAKIMPNASYNLDINLHAKSYVAQKIENKCYQFYRKSQLIWLTIIDQRNILTEEAAQQYFKTQYEMAVADFLLSELAKNVCKNYPQSQWGLSPIDETWQHFLDGTYGLCTRSGMPNEIFLKQIYVRYIDFLNQKYTPNTMGTELRIVLSKAVNALDKVESDFAPHEVAHSSRQRCITNIKKDYSL